MSFKVGPSRCDYCPAEYGDHNEDCPNHPKNKPFKPTMNLRFRGGVLEQEFVRQDEAREWREVPYV